MEFGYDLLAAAPMAWWLCERGQLRETHGPVGSRWLYPFSPQHYEHREGRDCGWHRLNGLPVPDIHAEDVTRSEYWSLPPYRFLYGRWQSPYDKPHILICNKRNTQWTDPNPSPNYIDIPSLRLIVAAHRSQFAIVYARYQYESNNNADDVEFDDFAMLAAEFPEVMLLHEQADEISGNRLLFQHATTAAAVLTVQGGTAIMGSIFGLRNFIFARQGDEVHHDSYRWW